MRVDELDAGVAVGHDASALGLSMVAASRLEVGSLVHLTFQLPPGSDNLQTVTGHVVRVEQNVEDPEGMWPHRIALQFDDPDPELESTLRDLERRGMAKKK